MGLGAIALMATLIVGLMPGVVGASIIGGGGGGGGSSTAAACFGTEVQAMTAESTQYSGAITLTGDWYPYGSACSASSNSFGLEQDEELGNGGGTPGLVTADAVQTVEQTTGLFVGSWSTSDSATFAKLSSSGGAYVSMTAQVYGFDSYIVGNCASGDSGSATMDTNLTVTVTDKTDGGTVVAQSVDTWFGDTDSCSPSTVSSFEIGCLGCYSPIYTSTVFSTSFDATEDHVYTVTVTFTAFASVSVSGSNVQSVAGGGTQLWAGMGAPQSGYFELSGATLTY